MLEAPFGTVGALATGFGWITGQAGSIFLILRSSCGRAAISRRKDVVPQKRLINFDLPGAEQRV